MYDFARCPGPEHADPQGAVPLERSRCGSSSEAFYSEISWTISPVSASAESMATSFWLMIPTSR